MRRERRGGARPCLSWLSWRATRRSTKWRWSERRRERLSSERRPPSQEGGTAEAGRAGREKELREEAGEEFRLKEEMEKGKRELEQSLILKGDLEGLRALNGTKEEGERSAAKTSRFKLQELQLPTFNGDLLQFSHFWECFLWAVDGEEMPQPMKFQYLLSVVKQPTLQLISGLSIDEEGYDQAKQILVREFGDPLKTFRLHFQKFMELPRASVESGSHVRSCGSAQSVFDVHRPRGAGLQKRSHPVHRPVQAPPGLL